MSVAQPHPIRTPDAIGTKYHLDLDKLDLVAEDLMIRRRRIAVARPMWRDAERLAAIAARLEREALR
jgi:hypothetical protein